VLSWGIINEVFSERNAKLTSVEKVVPSRQTLEGIESMKVTQLRGMRREWFYWECRWFYWERR
jgi:hypothetical protein